MACDLTDGVYAKCGDPITCSQRRFKKVASDWSCVWCGKPLGTKDGCTTPDGDGHLFRQNTRKELAFPLSKQKTKTGKQRMTSPSVKDYTETMQVEYHSSEWDSLVERGYITSTVDANNTATMVYIGH